MDNLGEMDKFLERFNLPSLNQEEIENMNRPFIIIEIEGVIFFKLPTNKSPGQDNFTGEFHQTFKGELIPILKLFQKISEERTFPNSLYEVSLTLIQKPEKDITKKGKYRQYHL